MTSARDRVVTRRMTMETKEYRTIDRKAVQWPSGPWDSEPDKVQWPDEETSLPCLAVRHPHSGHWCGYVGVTEGHPFFGKGYNDVDVNVHGGLTFARACNPKETEAEGICHLPGEGEPDHVWWFGFDCAHSGDRGPRDEYFSQTKGYPFTPSPNETYKPLSYVKNECASLAKQLAALARSQRRRGRK